MRFLKSLGKTAISTVIALGLAGNSAMAAEYPDMGGDETKASIEKIAEAMTAVMP